MSPVCHLFKHELRRNLGQAISWTITVTAIVLLQSAFIPSIGEWGDAMASILETYPEALLKAFGLGNNPIMITQPLGFHVIESGTMITILGGIFATSLAANLLLKEERDSTADFLLAQPLSRMQIWIGKAAAAGIYVLGFNVMITSASIAVINILSPDPVDLRAMVIYHTYVLLLTVLLASLGLLLSSAMRRGRTMTGIAAGITLSGFFVNAISKTTEAAKPLGYISPYQFVNSAVLDPDYGLSLGRLSYFLLGTTLLLLVSAVLYSRKDIVA